MVAPSQKPKLSEMRAADRVMETVLRRATAEWPRIYGQFKETFGDRFRVDGDQAAILDLSLAALALDAQALPNLFPTELAKRLTAWLEQVVNTPEFGEYAVSELREYRRVFQEGLAATQAGGDALECVYAVAVRLLRRWLEGRLALFNTAPEGRDDEGIVDPFLIMLTVDVLKSYAGNWRSLRDEYELEPEDLPVGYRDWEAFGLYEPGKCPRPKRPDGTLVLRGADGRPICVGCRLDCSTSCSLRGAPSGSALIAPSWSKDLGRAQRRRCCLSRMRT